MLRVEGEEFLWCPKARGTPDGLPMKDGHKQVAQNVGRPTEGGDRRAGPGAQREL